VGARGWGTERQPGKSAAGLASGLRPAEGGAYGASPLVTDTEVRESLRLAREKKSVASPLHSAGSLLRQDVDALDFPSFMAVVEELLRADHARALTGELPRPETFVARRNKQA
jgi:hypothetical protein